MSATALIRRPSAHLDEGIVSHIEREPVDVARAVEQWDGYVAALQTSGWHTVEVPPADDCPDSVFVEDTMVVFGGTVVISRPGTPTRQPETIAAEQTVSTFGYDVRRITAPGTLDGGDVLKVGDVMYVDACGVVNRYHADVCRTFAIGRDHPEARAILDVTAQSVDEVRRAVRPGDPLDVAQRAAEDFVFSRFPREQVWWVGGYALGIAMAPNWVGHTYLSNDAFEQFTWEPGYVTNYENILFDRDAGFTASYMETLLMTESGIEVLSELPRTLAVLGMG